MAFKTLWLTSDGAGAVVYTAAEWRHVWNMYTAGVFEGLAVTQNGTPNMTVQMAAGRAVIQGVSTEGRYLAYSTAATTGITIGAAPVTVGQSRNDLVCLFTKDPAAAGGTAGRVTEPVVVPGTAAATGSQTDPAVPAFHQAIARVTVAQGTAAITNAMITDLRSFATLAFDVVDDVNATRLGATGPDAGTLVRRTPDGRIGIGEPTLGNNATTKTYVDAGDAAAVTAAGGSINSGTIQYRKMGNMVFVWTTQSWNSSVAATIPAGYRPSTAVGCAAVNTAADASGITVATTGVITALGGIGNWQFSMAYQVA